MIPIRSDLIRKGEVEAMIRRFRPRGVIHAAADASPERCQTDPESSRKVNVTASLEIAACCARLDIPLVFVSTDLVFDGDRAPYAESDTPRPISVYGVQKAEAEERVRTVWPQTVICRLPLLFGFSRSAPGGVLAWMLPALRTGERLQLFTDEIRTPVDAASAANGLLAALHWASGIYHLGGATPISRWDFGHLLAQILAVPSPSIDAARIADVSEAAPRPANVSLSSEKARALGWRPAVLESALADTVRRWEGQPL